MKKAFSFLLLAVLSLNIISCGEENDRSSKNTTSQQVKTPETKEAQSFTKEQIKELKTASKVVYSLPSPDEMAQILQETGAIYDVDILNDPRALSQYYTDLSRSLNLGVYFADLSFTSMFDYPQQAMLYMSAAQGLAEELSIEGVFTEELMNRLDANMNNKDSIMEIVSYAYLETDLYLQENDRAVMAKAILAGAWVEGLYIASNLKTTKGNQAEIDSKIGMQQDALGNLIKMLGDTKEKHLDPLTEKLDSLSKAFSLVEEIKASTPGQESTYQMSDLCKERVKTQAEICRSLIVSSPK